jgi:hypothetical protein
VVSGNKKRLVATLDLPSSKKLIGKCSVGGIRTSKGPLKIKIYLILKSSVLYLDLACSNSFFFRQV